MKRIEKIVDHLGSSSSSSSSFSKKEDNKEEKKRFVSSSSFLPELKSNPTSKVLYGNRSGNTSKYRYTLDKFADEVFTSEQRDFYDQNGYIVIRKVLNDEEVKYFYNRLDVLMAKPELRQRIFVMKDISLKNKTVDPTDSNVVTKLQDWAYEEGLWKYAKHEKVAAYAKAICGKDLRAMHFMLINKPPDSGTLTSRHPFHQDQWYFPFGPADHTVCSWTALQTINRHNGCLSVVPGSHRNAPGGKLLTHDYPKQWSGPLNKAYHGIQVDDINPIIRKRVHLEMEAGDTVFFHPLLLHASGTNLSNATRRSISVHYASSTLCEYFHVEELGQQKIAEEALEMGKKFYGTVRIPFHSIWAAKSRQVCGDEGRLKLGADPAK